MKIDPNNISANYDLATVYQNIYKDFDLAIEYYSKILEIDNSNYESHFQIGLCLIEKNEIKSGIKKIKECLTINSKFSPGMFIMFIYSI